MRLRSEIELPASSWKIDHSAPLVAMGSCFSDRIGHRLQQAKFSTLINPFGILYHPLAMLAPLTAALDGQNPFAEGFFEHEGRWQSFDLHTQVHAPTRAALQEQVEAQLARTREALLAAQALVITFGTALAFRHLAQDRIVANCHRVASREFAREMLPLAELEAALQQFVARLLEYNPDIKVLLTVSPIRHLRSGIVENSASKAILRVLCEQIAHSHPAVSYFPAYEIMLDDLRDYRFYATDLVHPTELAEQYIWEKFTATYMSEQTQRTLHAIVQVRQDLAHQPRNPHSTAHRNFLLALQGKLERLSEQLDCSEELKMVAERLQEA